MNNRTKGVIAGIAGLALLTGGTTFAVWTASASTAGAVITNGNLAIAAPGSVAWYDTSADRTDATAANKNPISGANAHAIANVGNWRMVPGDTVEGNFPLEVAMSGDNLVATLAVTSTALTGLPTGVTVTYDVYRAAQGAETAPQRVVTGGVFGTASNLRFAAPRTGQEAGAPVIAATTIVANETALSGAANMWVVVKVAFASSATGSMNATTTLTSLTATLTQVRTVGSGDGF
jgi:alternate signal-mediated exported protein